MGISVVANPAWPPTVFKMKNTRRERARWRRLGLLSVLLVLALRPGLSGALPLLQAAQVASQQAERDAQAAAKEPKPDALPDPKPAEKTPAQAQTPATAQAQAKDPKPAEVPLGPEDRAPINRESPRAALALFLDLCEHERYAEAARYLDTQGQSMDGPTLARQLYAVLQRHSDLNLGKLSSAATGDLSDGLEPYVEEIAKIPTGNGGTAAARMVRREHEGFPSWLWSYRTVVQIPDWYGDLDERWMLEHLPRFLLRLGPAHLTYWQWLAMPVALLMSLGLGMLLSRISNLVLSSVTARTRTTWDDTLVTRLSGPMTMFWMLLVLSGLVPFMGLYAQALQTLKEARRGAFTVMLLWALLRTLDVVGQALSASAWAQQRPSARSLIPLGRRLLKAALWVLAFIGVVSAFGYPVASLLAGLGIGGLAVALAAQKTVENLFGAFSIGTDQPFREGDFIKLENNAVGTVEEIGLRSTRIRTPDRTVLSLPNGKLADMRIESYAPRDRILLSQDLWLSYQTTPQQLRAVLASIEETLRAHPKVWPENMTVRLKQLGESALVVEVTAWFQTTNWSEFTQIRQDVLLRLMEIVESAGTGFAFPARSVHIVGGDAGLRARADGAAARAPGDGADRSGRHARS